MKYDPARCTREFKHGPHTYNKVRVMRKAWCPGRARRPIRAVLMFLEAMKETR